MHCETVAIKTEAGIININKSDFDKDKHALAKKPSTKASKKK